MKDIERTANVAWSPKNQSPIYLAAGTAASQLDASFNTNAGKYFYILKTPQKGRATGKFLLLFFKRLLILFVLVMWKVSISARLDILFIFLVNFGHYFKTYSHVVLLNIKSTNNEKHLISALEIYALNITEPGPDTRLVSTLASEHRFHKLLWGAAGADSLGTIIAGCDDGLLQIYRYLDGFFMPNHT